MEQLTWSVLKLGQQSSSPKCLFLTKVHNEFASNLIITHFPIVIYEDIMLIGSHDIVHHLACKSSHQRINWWFSIVVLWV